MIRFWAIAVRPALLRAEARTVIEVGAGDAVLTRRLAAWCRRRGADLHLVDAHPRCDPARFADPAAGIRVDRRPALEALADVPGPDAVLLHAAEDGEAVRPLLEWLLAGTRETPIVLCHGVSDGAAAQAVDELVVNRGGGLTSQVLPVVGGLAIVAAAERLERQPGLADWLRGWDDAAGWRTLAGLADHERREEQARARQPPPAPAARVEAVAGRSFRVGLPPDVLSRIQQGTLDTSYRGVRFLKNPFDVVLYQELIGRLRPATIVEIGSKEGGSALWFADQQGAHGVPPRVLSVDVESPSALTDERITFLRGDALCLEETLDTTLMSGLPRPWLVVEDSAHLFETTIGSLEFFHRWLQPGDYIVVEDGSLADFPEPAYQRFADGPNRAVKQFLEAHGPAYAIDRTLCDRYGHNVTWAPNAWLRRRPSVTTPGAGTPAG